MVASKLNRKLDGLLGRGEWQEARTLLEREREKAPEDHWLLTQLGVTFYEQGQYQDALELFAESLQIVLDCPLTLWNLAGTLDALGKPAEALRIYAWLMQSDISAAEDPCWESPAWADALKADCVYRMGACFQHLGKKRKAEHCYRQYLHLLSLGIDGTYSLEDVQRQVGDLHGREKNGVTEREIRWLVDATLKATGLESGKHRRSAPPQFDWAALIPGRRVAGKK